MTDWLTESRERQGLPPDRIEDPATVGRLHALLMRARKRKAEQDRRTDRAA